MVFSLYNSESSSKVFLEHSKNCSIAFSLFGLTLILEYLVKVHPVIFEGTIPVGGYRKVLSNGLGTSWSL